MKCFNSHYQSPIGFQRGLSLIELMIAIALGIVLSAGVIEIYIGSKQTYRSQNALSRLQENGRYALEQIAGDMRRSGYIGCGNMDKFSDNNQINVVVAAPVIAAYNNTTAFTGNDNRGAQNWGPALAVPVGAVDNDTDVVTVTGAGSCITPVTADMAGTAGAINISAANPCGFSQSEVLLVADCSTADVFRLTNDPAASGQLQHGGLSAAYTSSAASEVMSFSSNTYFVRTPPATGIPTLFVLDNTQAVGANNPIALIEGVENIQVTYGVDNDDDGVPESYSDAAAVSAGAQWGEVVAARVVLLVRTIDQLNAADFNFNQGGTNVTYGGGFVRQQFTTTVKLRNRGLL